MKVGNKVYRFFGKKPIRIENEKVKQIITRRPVDIKIINGEVEDPIRDPGSVYIKDGEVYGIETNIFTEKIGVYGDSKLVYIKVGPNGRIGELETLRYDDEKKCNISVVDIYGAIDNFTIGGSYLDKPINKVDNVIPSA